MLLHMGSFPSFREPVPSGALVVGWTSEGPGCLGAGFFFALHEGCCM